ncbi:MAG: glycosyltransferase family 2 protein [Cetobacterium sp.]|uniref:glycosyltransferase family 2 protein n=1 Tax=Cetobacterium sp. TaxID=2071632 RepID=UPI003F3DBD93
MKKEYLLSILIPTKNREEYLIETVNQILKINNQKIQIVIQDNSDISVYDNLKKCILNNNNIKYNYTPGILSFVKNFDIGIEICDGEYICLIGDDDGIMPQIISIVEWAKNNNQKVIKPSLNTVYFWPNSEVKSNLNDNGNVIINKISGNVKIYNSRNELKKLLRQGCQDYLGLGMAKLYHGIVKKEVLEEVKNKVGKYVGGLSPDIYIAVAISLVVDEVVEIDFPLTIPGICKKSGSSDSSTGKHTGKLEDAPHFRGHTSYNWSELVPKFYSVETIWADSCLAAINDFSEKEILKEFNLEFLTLDCLKKYSNYKEFILKNYKNQHKIIDYKKGLNYFIYSLKNFISRVVKVLKRQALKLVIRKQYKFEKIENISFAVELIQQELNKENIQIEKILTTLEKLKIKR